MGKAFTEEEKSRIKVLMVTNARRAFENQPFQDVKVEHITKATGISKGAFYLFYKSKEELFIDVLIQVESEMQLQIIRKLSQQVSLRDQMKTILVDAIHTYEQGYLFKSFEDSMLQAAILAKATDVQKEQMLMADQRFLEQLISDEKCLKVPRNVALDLMRSLFYILPYKTHLESTFDEFIDYYVSAVVEAVIYEDAPGIKL